MSRLKRPRGRANGIRSRDKVEANWTNKKAKNGFQRMELKGKEKLRPFSCSRTNTTQPLFSSGSSFPVPPIDGLKYLPYGRLLLLQTRPRGPRGRCLSSLAFLSTDQPIPPVPVRGSTST